MCRHLMCIEVSQEISDAYLGSNAFSFAPKSTKSGVYIFEIGSAGSTSLVLHTLLPTLLFANADQHFKSTVTIKSGTHNPLAPTKDISPSKHLFLRLRN